MPYYMCNTYVIYIEPQSLNDYNLITHVRKKIPTINYKFMFENKIELSYHYCLLIFINIKNDN